MRAMILAAGRGERLRPLTDTLPKPLVEAGGKRLIEYHLENLAAAGFREVVINKAHLAGLLVEQLANGERWGLTIHWSDEQPEALETGGGMLQALPLLGKGPFAVVNGDVWSDFPLSRLRSVKCDWAHLVMVSNPEHNPSGDFSLQAGRLRNDGINRLTYSGIGVYHPRLFDGCEAGKFSVVPLLRQAMEKQLVTGEHHIGAWSDVGTLHRLEELRNHLTG